MYRENGITRRSNKLKLRIIGLLQSCCHQSQNLKAKSAFAILVMENNDGCAEVFLVKGTANKKQKCGKKKQASWKIANNLLQLFLRCMEEERRCIAKLNWGQTMKALKDFCLYPWAQTFGLIKQFKNSNMIKTLVYKDKPGKSVKDGLAK